MRSLGEIRFRLGQYLERNLDRTVSSRNCFFRDGRMNLKHAAVGEITGYLRSREYAALEERFFRSFSDPDETRQVFEACFPGEGRTTIDGAKRIMKGTFPIFGRNLWYGSPPSWHFDPVNRKSAPLRFHSEIDFLDFRQCGDHKVIWELNRHQYMLVLAKAYWLSGEDQYVNQWVSQVEDWMRTNPPGFGINWASSLEIAYRSIAWIWCWFFFRRSRLLSDHFRLKYLLYLHEAGRMIERNLSRYFSPNTHLTGEALGLVYLGLFFSGLKQAEGWYRQGTNILLEQLEHHVRTDGSYMEQSTWYHKYTTDIYLHFAVLQKANARLVPSVLLDKVQNLLDFILLTAKPDGTSPVIGDDDGGTLIPLGSADPRDFRGALSTGAVLFGRADYKGGSGGYSQETLWMLGPASREAYSRLGTGVPKTESAAFREGGYFVMRNGWTGDSDYMLIDCGHHGWLRGGHAHADLNSIVVCVGGHDFLVDPGTYTYSESEVWRNYFRASQAHNTVAADGLSQSLPAGPFSWVVPGRPESVRWLSLDGIDYFEGCASVYRYLGDPIIHTREIVFMKEERFWIVRDRLQCGECHELSSLLHFPHASVRLEGNRFVLEGRKGACASAFVQAFPQPCLFTVDDWVSPVYSMKVPSKTGVCQLRGTEAVFMTVIEGSAKDNRWEYRHEPSGDRLSRADAEIGFMEDGSGEGRMILLRTGPKKRYLCLDCSGISVDGTFRMRLARKIGHAFVETGGPGPDGQTLRVRFSEPVDFEVEEIAENIRLETEGEPCAASADRP